jgi:hypothetical protein
LEPILAAVLFFFALWFTLWLLVLLSYRMAISRDRSGVIWVLVSLFGSPFLAIILLLILG